jgi:hypothetical protein
LFAWNDDSATVITDNNLLSIHKHDLSCFDSHEQEARIEALLQEAQGLTFDFEQRPILHLFPHHSVAIPA